MAYKNVNTRDFVFKPDVILRFFSKYSIFNSLRKIGIHLYTVFRQNPKYYFQKQLSFNGRYLKKSIFNNFQILHKISTNLGNSISEIKSMCSLKVFRAHF
jgi:hypothetical protein